MLEAALSPLGFQCQRLRFTSENSPPIENLFARYDSPRGALSRGALSQDREFQDRESQTPRPCLGFAGHTDVVPVGARSQWSLPPFGGIVQDGRVWGRGAADMKGGIAAFVAAAAQVIGEADAAHPFSLVLIITGDEEGPAVNGTSRFSTGWRARTRSPTSVWSASQPTRPTSGR